MTDAIRKDLDEDCVRLILYRYVEKFVGIAGRFHASSRKEVDPVWASRVEGFVQTATYKKMATAGTKITTSLFGVNDVGGMIHQLMSGPNAMEPGSIMKIFLSLDKLVQLASDPQLVELLSGLTSSDGACLPFAFGLFHERFEVQLAAARIILRLYIQKVF